MNDERQTTERHTGNKDEDEGIFLIPYPKFVFFYPTTIVAILAAITLYFTGHETIGPSDRVPVAVTSIFLVVFSLNLIVIVFDFPRSASLLVVLAIATLGLAGWLVLLFNPNWIPFLRDAIVEVRPVANATFYTCVTVVMMILYVAVWLAARLDYWELRANELIHHHGIWSDMKRYPAPNLRIDKEINDVFEHMMLGAGRLVLHPANEDRAIVLDNVLFVNDKETRLTEKLGSLKVRIHND